MSTSIYSVIILLCTAVSFAVGQNLKSWRNGEVESIYHVVVRPPGLIARNLTLGRPKSNSTAGVKFPPPRAPSNSTDGESDDDRRSIEINRQKINFALLCSDGVPLLGDNDKPKLCSPSPHSPEYACPSTFWCHVGSTNSTYYCCPKNKKVDNACHLPPANGFGTGRMKRWWFDWRAKICRELTYTGFGGNENNHLTKDDCEKTCASSKATSQEPEVTVYIPPGAGVPGTVAQSFPTQQPWTSPLPVSIVTASPSTQSGNSTQKPTTDAAGGRNEREKAMDPCELSPDKGKVVASRSSRGLKWYFDVAASRCVQFNFLGGGGNENNFDSENACIETCGGGALEPSSCQMSMELGDGPFKIDRWFFDSRTKLCEQFIYTGRKGNANRFPTRKLCEQACGAIDPNSIDPTKNQASPNKDGKQSYSNLLPAPFPTLNAPSPSTRLPEYLTAGSRPAPSSPTFIRVPATADSSYNKFMPASSTGTQTTWTASTEVPTGSPSSSVPVYIPTISEQTPTASVTQLGSQPSSTYYVNTQPTFGPTSHTFVTIAPPSLPPSNTVDEESQGATIHAQAARPVAVAIPVPAPSLPPMSALPVGMPVQPCRQTSAMFQMCTGQGGPCPDGTFCQIGASNQQSVCCPVLGGNACAQPMLAGTGTGTASRFYYDPNANRCTPFIYHGYQGNQNNFLTYELCQQACGGINPCEVGEPFQVNGGNSRCSPSQQSCPAQYYCHVGADTLNSVCCPMQQQQGAQPMPCTMDPAPGSGSASLQRWAYSPVRRACQTFTYTGTAGNQNNFLTRSDCVQTCATMLNPCGTGVPLTNGNSYQQCVTFGASTCPNSYFCHMGATPDTTVCCPITGNQCQLTLSTGSGTAVLSRYYFDAASSTCKAFTYSGLGGNENNFLSLADCRRACPEYDNPCPGGTPPINTADGSVGFCSATNPTCPSTYWCHFGASRQDTVCCPFAGDPCNMPCVPGTGFAQLPRYSYSPTTRSCEPFTYTGKAGNQNNFLSKADCEAACPVLDNPCSAGFPATTTGGAAVLCSIANPAVCPNGYWCHIGATAATTLCCPGAGDACRMPLARGNGNSVLNRWYYNTDTQTCVSFTYSGRGGNQNNFVSLAECRQQCPEFHFFCRNPCSTGQPHIGLSGQITHCGATTPSICPTTYWCHIGATLDTSVCCPGAGNPCELPLATGNGNANLLRFYYDRVTQACLQFQYTGFGGNENNFVTQQACEARCPVFINPCAAGNPARDANQNIVTCSVANMAVCPSGFFCHIGASEQTTLCCPGNANPCTEPSVPGTGDASLPRFVYNSLTQQCLPFIYSGIGGNQNNFLSRAECEARCPVLQNPCTSGEPATGSSGQYVLCSSNTPNVCPAGYWCHIGAVATNSICCPGADNPCLLPLATGTGSSALGRWYFDTNLRRCTRFTYTGTGGNQNNFLTMQECQLRCPEFQNPCSTGDPAQAPSGGILFCSANLQTCPASYWCHIGSNADNTVCCPGAGDPCLAAMLPGTGTSKLVRWYFNQNTRQCLQFTYTGIGGNQNNFLSEAMCIQRCPVFRNPCTNQLLQLDSIVACSAQNTNVCPAGYWCHIGGDATTSVCCPGAADPCQLPCSQGIDSGIGPFTRYYFDPQQRICKPFQYTGLGGNENNFLTREDCAMKCPEFINPCYMGEPYRETVTSLVRFCNTNAPIDCPNNYWCHVGAQPQTTVCCPGSQDPCTTPLAIGSGPANLPRWYFNVQARTCQQFTYTGIGGNQNNFLTREACQRVCPEFSNPCGGGAPLTSLTGVITYCTAQNVNICPNGYYCHIGSSQESTVCCPGAADPCQLPMDVGRGSSALTRYYYNTLTRQCAQFTYSGEGGNANNFIALQQCRQTCPEFNNPCIGQPYRPIGGDILYCSSGSPCPPNYFCHYGADTTATMCCPNAGNPCVTPVVIGAGTGQLTRYYYNAALQQCVPFIYSGLGGNQNNFLSALDCANSCVRPAVAPCPTPPCQLSLPLVQTAPVRLCPQGDPLSLGSGMPVSCSLQAVTQCPNNDYVCNVMSSGDAYCCPDPRNFCLQPRNPGACQPTNGLSTRYGYNPATDTCVEFKYTGCDGNLNNFGSAAECSNICCNKGYNLLRLRDSPDGDGSVPEGSGESNSDSDLSGLDANSTLTEDQLLDYHNNDEIAQNQQQQTSNRTRTRAVARRGGWMDILRFW